MIRFSVHTDLSEIEAVKLAAADADKILISQVHKDTSKYVPYLTGSLNQRSHIVGNMVIYPGPYARYLYFGKVMVDSETGKGPRYIPEVGYRFRKYATLTQTNRNLVFTKNGHPQATAHWFEVSKSRNLKRWISIAERAITNGR